MRARPARAHPRPGLINCLVSDELGPWSHYWIGGDTASAQATLEAWKSHAVEAKIEWSTVEMVLYGVDWWMLMMSARCCLALPCHALPCLHACATLTANGQRKGVILQGKAETEHPSRKIESAGCDPSKTLGEARAGRQ